MSFLKTYNSLLFSFILVLGVHAQQKEKIDFTSLGKVLQEEYADGFEFSVVVETNEMLFSGYFGYLDSDKNVAVNDSTLFNIASITKSITAVGVLKLVEEKRLTLDDPLDKFFMDVPDDKAAISVRLLLSHRSGLPQTYPLDGISDPDKARKALWKEKLEFAPGSGFRYSNQNYQVLALIIGKVMESPFEAYIRNKVLSPLGMDNTHFWHEADALQNMAPLTGRIASRLGKRNWGYIGGAGIFSTTDDLYKFWNGLSKKDFLSKESIRLLFGNYYETGSGIQIGYGFYTSPQTRWNSPEQWSRGTESWGHNAVIRFFPEKNCTIIVATNSGEIGNDRNQTGNRLISDRIADYVFD